ncbi:SDR family oxidoreductase [Pseudonocardia ailaonensis]|uniref:SDR family oxidoreductase n=1 Tax=Pseudonocardia ailaonensis TaxID=367279 RepID=A0ABN2MRW3_9PSEU
MPPLLDGKVVLVSGGTSGVGAAVARAALTAGARVAITGRRREHGEKLAAEMNASHVPGPRDVAHVPLDARVVFVPCDVADPEQVRAAVDAVVAEFGRVDSLVNAAGLTDRGTLLDTTPELFDRHVAVGLRGPFFAMQAVVRDMLRRKAPGTIVNIGSEQGYGGAPVLAPYAAAKGGLAALTKNVAHAHRFDRVRVNQLNIGWTDTEGEDATQRAFHAAGDDWRERAAAGLPAGRLGDPAEIAEMVVFLLSDRSGVVTGSVVEWDQAVIGAHD